MFLYNSFISPAVFFISRSIPNSIRPCCPPRIPPDLSSQRWARILHEHYPFWYFSRDHIRRYKPERLCLFLARQLEPDIKSGTIGETENRRQLKATGQRYGSWQTTDSPVTLIKKLLCMRELHEITGLIRHTVSQGQCSKRRLGHCAQKWEIYTF